ncbi:MULTISPECIES: hypothetical protein [Streptomyces]|uniref:Secreted protein n=1 Tax=Streptomyces doudnae TaxID=3075536 RepID=A0ABD5EEV1_9ACTN|nr:MULTISPECIES: hypothetical protein [unclassified Streptomyces]MDT0433202.1 hypothetical protein [Streptomyces sp. DSM 41981]MYQ68110.1 hypothetical protein [Streptomyces sp. SID4950]SCE43133.1 hypothetical protein GA0115242_13712 [Streptomyces sp. SolWspMP-5a-2]
MQRPGLAASLRGIAVAGSVLALSLTGATAASAQTGSGQTSSAVSRQEATVQRAAPAPAGYRGTQGFNLCLLSRCSTGSDSGDGGGVGLVQGGNLCLLSVCELRS